MENNKFTSILKDLNALITEKEVENGRLAGEHQLQQSRAKARLEAAKKLYELRIAKTGEPLRVSSEELEKLRASLAKLMELVPKPVETVVLEQLPSVLGAPIEELQFSERTYDMLAKGGCLTIESLALHTREQLNVRYGMGFRELEEVEEKLKERALELARLPFFTVNSEQVKSADSTEGLKKVLNLKIEDLDFSQRTFNCLRRAEVFTLEMITREGMADLRKIRGFGGKSGLEVNGKLAEYNLPALQPGHQETSRIR